MEDGVFIVDRRAKAGKEGLHKLRNTSKKTRKPASKFIPPKVKVEKKSFDLVLGNLIQGKPESGKRLK